MTEKSKPPTGPGIITGAQVARLLDLSPRRVQQLAAAGAIPRIDRDAYPLVGVVQGYIRWLTDEGRRSEQVTAMVRVNEQRAAEIAMRIAGKMGDLIPFVDFKETLAATVNTVRSELLKVPDRLPVTIRPALKAEIARSIETIEKAAERAVVQAAAGHVEF